MTTELPTETKVPSWLRWPPNCCETCQGPWKKTGDWTGRCERSESFEYGTTTDSRFRCASFQCKEGM